MTNRVALRQNEAVELAHAIVASESKSLGIRALIIKGPILHLQGLRVERDSADVDVLIEASERARFVSHMQLLGWEARAQSVRGRVLENHAISLIHPHWPCDIDAHDRYPGMFAPASVVFETLWSRKVEVLVASNFVTAADVLSNAAILGAHALREPRRARNKDELAFLATALRTNLTSGQRAEFAELVSTLRAKMVLRPLMTQLGLDDGENDLTPYEWQQWAMRTSDDSTVLGWAAGISKTPFWGLPAYLFRALYPAESEMRLLHPDIEDGWRALTLARLRRLRHGANHLGPAVRSLRRTLRQGSA